MIRIEYADKAHTKIGDTYEFGTFAESGDRSDLTDIMDDIEGGLDEVELSRKHHGKYARLVLCGSTPNTMRRAVKKSNRPPEKLEQAAKKGNG